MEAYEVHLSRTINAVQLKPVDKIPFSYSGPAYVSRRQGVKISEYLSNPQVALKAAMEFCRNHPGIDSIHSPTMNAHMLSILWLSEVRIPGVDLPDDELWQVLERERMTTGDYKEIIENGYFKWMLHYTKDRIGNPIPALVKAELKAGNVVKHMRKEAGLPVMNGANIGSPVECYSGGRQLMNFFMDALDDPDTVKGAMDKAQSVLENLLIAQIKKNKPISAWVGGWRAAPQLISHEMFMDFVWPYIERLIHVCLAHDVIPCLHFDSCWDRELETLKSLPSKKCILMLDGSTDMRKAREILDDRMCLMGDVPANMLAYSTADEVYDYCMKLIRDVGSKTGLILGSGCDCPLNAKDENVDAMIQASLDYRVG